MWLSRSFTFVLGFHLIILTLLGFLLLPTFFALVASPSFPFYILGLVLWHQHDQARKSRKHLIYRHWLVWIESAIFVVAAISYYLFLISSEASISALPDSEDWTMVIFTLVLPVYLLILAVLGIIQTVLVNPIAAANKSLNPTSDP